METNDLTAAAAAPEIVTTRLFEAPVDRVFEAWSRADYLGHWWGPRGFTTTTHAFDFRPGGVWKHTMHGPDGADFPNRIVYEEIVPPTRIVYAHHGGIEGVPAQFRQTVTFAARGDRTEVTMRMVFNSAAERDAVVAKYGAIEGAKQTLERLEEHLRSAKSDLPQLRMTRVFDAPRHLVFEAWSKAEYLSRWFTPAPLTTAQCEVDMRPGGVFRLVMRMPDGTEHPMDGRFTEVIPNERIAFAARITGDLELQTTVTLAEQDGKTTLSVLQIYSRASDATRGAHAGWTSTLDQLAEYLRSRVAPPVTIG